jgi:intracellular sulfur oxidation DsrE/DsrF family protein
MTPTGEAGGEMELNSFVDGELALAERGTLLARAAQDPTLGEQICRLRGLKDQVRLAYEQPPLPVRRRRPRQRTPFCLTSTVASALAAVALLIGLVTGWTLHHSDPAARFVLLDSAGRGAAPAAADSGEMRIVVHVVNADQAVAGEVLDEVESLLQAYERDGRPLRVEVVANGEGLGLLRAGFSRYEARIHTLAGRYPNLAFVACKNTIDRLRAFDGIEVRLVPDVEVTDSGVSRVVQRQREGWAYIQV